LSNQRHEKGSEQFTVNNPSSQLTGVAFHSTDHARIRPNAGNQKQPPICQNPYSGVKEAKIGFVYIDVRKGEDAWSYKHVNN
jgi:hypothetical protein